MQRPGAHWAPSEIDAQRLTDQLRASRLTVLCGGPGAPTPQVLQAGVLPRVHRRAEDRGKGDRPASAKALPSEDRRHGSSGSDAEVSVLFDQWNESARAALKAALQAALRGHSASRGGALPQRFDDLVIALSERYRVRFLLLFDRFEDCVLAHPSGDLRALREEIYSAVNRPQVPAHFLLTLREDGEPLLDRLRGRIRGFDPVRKPFPLDGAQGIGPWTLSWVPPVLAPARSRPPKTQAVYASIEALLGQMAQRGAAQAPEPLSAEDEALLASVADEPGPVAETDPASAAFEPLAFAADGPSNDQAAPPDDALAPLAQDEHWAAFDAMPLPVAAAPDSTGLIQPPGADREEGEPVLPEIAAAAETAAATESDEESPVADSGSPGEDSHTLPPVPAPEASTAAAPRELRSAAARGATFSAESLAQFMAELDDVIAESSSATADAVRAPPPPPPPVLAELARWPDAPSPASAPSQTPPPATAAADEPPALQTAADADVAMPAPGIDDPPIDETPTDETQPPTPPPPTTTTTTTTTTTPADETTAALEPAAPPAAPEPPSGIGADGPAEAAAADGTAAPERPPADVSGDASGSEADPPADSPPTATAEPTEEAGAQDPSGAPDATSSGRDVALLASPRATAAVAPARRNWGHMLRQRRSLRAAQRARALESDDDASRLPFWRLPVMTTSGGRRRLVAVLAVALLGWGLWSWFVPDRGVSPRVTNGPSTPRDPATAASPGTGDLAAGELPAAAAPLVELSAAGPLAQGLADELAQALPPGSGPTLLARGTQGWAADLSALQHPGRLAIARQDALQAARADASLGPLQIVLPLFTEELVFVVRADSPLRYIHQIEGRRLSVGAPESARALTVRSAYEQLFGRPLPPDKTDASDEPDALRELLEGRVDVAALVGTVPGAWPVAPALTDARQLRLLRLDRGHPASQRALRSLTAVQLAAGVDGLPATQPTQTLAVRSFLVAGASPGSEASANDLGGLARAVCRQLPTLQRDGHAKWREVRLGDLPQASWPYAPEAAFAAQDCIGRPPVRAAARPPAAPADASGPDQP